VTGPQEEELMHITNIAEAKASLSKLVEKVLQGEEVIIGKAGKPVAKLVPFNYDRSPRDLEQGIWKDQVWMAEDFDTLPEDLLKAFSGAGDDELAS
jgi:prevent-host-death family protein